MFGTGAAVFTWIALDTLRERPDTIARDGQQPPVIVRETRARHCQGMCSNLAVKLFPSGRLTQSDNRMVWRGCFTSRRNVPTIVARLTAHDFVSVAVPGSAHLIHVSTRQKYRYKCCATYSFSTSGQRVCCSKCSSNGGCSMTCMSAVGVEEEWA